MKHEPPKIDMRIIVENCEDLDRALGGSFEATWRPAGEEIKTSKPLPTDIVSLYAALSISPYF